MAVLLTCPNPACADLNDAEAARCESCGARMALGYITAEEVRLAQRLRALGPEYELRVGARELVALARAAADPRLRPTSPRAWGLWARARRKVERASEALAAAARRGEAEPRPLQECRGCGAEFAYDPEADFCPRCAAVNAGEEG